MEPTLDPISKARQPAYRRIADGLRAEIVSGRRAPGTQLPSTDELADIWESSTFTIHTALVTLVKEGWVERLNGTGTYVAERKNRFTCAAIYHGVDICSNEHPAFIRSLHGSLLEKLAVLGKEVQIFIDSRPLNAQSTILPALAEAIRHRRVQCLIAPTVNEVNSPALMRLPVPIVFNGHNSSPTYVNFDPSDFCEESVKRLVAQGCRSVGMITNVFNRQRAGNEDFQPIFHESFRRAVRSAGLEWREDWIRAPAQHVIKLPPYGYREFHEFWRQPEKPDGLIVYPDAVVGGVVTAALEIGLRTVTDRMKFVFHRNAHIDVLCPFPATWAISDEARLADGIVAMLEKQFRGEKVTPILVPYTFEYAEANSLSTED